MRLIPSDSQVCTVISAIHLSRWAIPAAALVLLLARPTPVDRLDIGKSSVVVTQNFINADTVMVGEAFHSHLTAAIKNPPRLPSEELAAPHWTWSMPSVTVSQCAGSCAVYLPASASSYTASVTRLDAPAADFTATFNDAGYYKLSVQAAATYHTSHGDATIKGTATVGGDPGDKCECGTCTCCQQRASQQPASQQQVIPPVITENP